ncbi:MAG: hypothetical protein K0S41_3274 [Anaerocolumna sp.]|jgi:hypothetical protein|nr:hypothetical protein [Anaerocolumna sp.]
MLLKKGVVLTDFLNDVKNCYGEVLFETEQGDSLNLKSVLSQYLFSVITADNDLLIQGHIICTEEYDYLKLENYLDKG